MCNSLTPGYKYHRTGSEAFALKNICNPNPSTKGTQVSYGSSMKKVHIIHSFYKVKLCRLITCHELCITKFVVNIMLILPLLVFHLFLLQSIFHCHHLLLLCHLFSLFVTFSLQYLLFHLLVHFKIVLSLPFIFHSINC